MGRQVFGFKHWHDFSNIAVVTGSCVTACYGEHVQTILSRTSPTVRTFRIVNSERLDHEYEKSRRMSAGPRTAGDGQPWGGQPRSMKAKPVHRISALAQQDVRHVRLIALTPTVKILLRAVTCSLPV